MFVDGIQFEWARFTRGCVRKPQDQIQPAAQRTAYSPGVGQVLRNGRAMPIRLIIRNDHAFSPEEADILIGAFEESLKALS